MNYKYRFFLSVTFNGEKIEREVSAEEFIKAERHAGFFGPGQNKGHPATSAFGGINGSVGGRVQYIFDDE